VVEWLRMQPVGVENADLKSSHYFIFIFSHILFNPGVTVLLKYLDPAIYTRLVFPYNLIAVNFKQRKVG